MAVLVGLGVIDGVEVAVGVDVGERVDVGVAVFAGRDVGVSVGAGIDVAVSAGIVGFGAPSTGMSTHDVLLAALPSFGLLTVAQLCRVAPEGVVTLPVIRTVGSEPAGTGPGHVHVTVVPVTEHVPEPA